MLKMPMFLLGLLLAFGLMAGRPLAVGRAETVPHSSSYSGRLRPGMIAPDFRLQNAAGGPVTMRELRGKVVYLDFWFKRCKPCLVEAPAAAKLKQAFLGQDVVFVYISIDTVVEEWKQTIADYALDGPNTLHLLDPEGGRAARAYGVVGFPTYLIIGRDGRVLVTDAPRPLDGSRTVAALRKALAVR